MPLPAGLSLDAEATATHAICRREGHACRCRCWARVLRRPDEADAAGVRRPGLTLATRPRALVTAPWPATIRYRGPLLDYGNVMILEPGGGYLLVLAGLDTVYGEVGEVVAAGAPLGLMGGAETATAEFLASAHRWRWRAGHGNALYGTQTGRRAGGPDARGSPALPEQETDDDEEVRDGRPGRHGCRGRC